MAKPTERRETTQEACLRRVIEALAGALDIPTKLPKPGAPMIAGGATNDASFEGVVRAFAREWAAGRTLVRALELEADAPSESVETRNEHARCWAGETQLTDDDIERLASSMNELGAISASRASRHMSAGTAMSALGPSFACLIKDAMAQLVRACEEADQVVSKKKKAGEGLSKVTQQARRARKTVNHAMDLFVEATADIPLSDRDEGGLPETDEAIAALHAFRTSNGAQLKAARIIEYEALLRRGYSSGYSANPDKAKRAAKTSVQRWRAANSHLVVQRPVVRRPRLPPYRPKKFPRV